MVVKRGSKYLVGQLEVAINNKCINVATVTVPAPGWWQQVGKAIVLASWLVTTSRQAGPHI